MLKEGMIVYYIDENQVYSGHVMDIEQHLQEYYFMIDSYGGCEGNYRIASSQIGISIFINKEDADIECKKRNHS